MGHRGIPPAPVDGEAYSSTGLLGLPLVLEYDDTTGGFKLVVATEAGVALYISGTVDTELGPPILAADNMANPTVPGFIGFNAVYENGPGTWRRRYAQVLNSGSLGSGPIAPYAGALGFGWDISAANRGWMPLQVGDYGEAQVNPSNLLMVKAFMQAAEQGGSSSYNLEMFRPDGDWEQWEGITSHLKVAGPVYAYDDAAVGFDRMRSEGASGSYAFRVGIWGQLGDGWSPAAVDAANNLMVNLGVRLDAVNDSISIPDAIGISGSFLTDDMANPYAPAMGSFLMGYTGDGNWDRVYMGISGSVLVDLASRLDAVNDEVTAYVTGTVDTELPAAATLTDAHANPTAPAVGAFGMFYDWDNGNWKRNVGHDIDLNFTSGDFQFAPVVIGTMYARQYNSTLHTHLRARDDVPGMINPLEVWTTGSAVEADLAIGKTLQRAAINHTGSMGDYELVAAVAGQSIKVTQLYMRGTAACDVVLKSGFTGTWLTGRMSIANDGEHIDADPATPGLHAFETASGENLVLTLYDGGAQIGGWLVYYTEP